MLSAIWNWNSIYADVLPNWILRLLVLLANPDLQIKFHKFISSKNGKATADFWVDFPEEAYQDDKIWRAFVPKPLGILGYTIGKKRRNLATSTDGSAMDSWFRSLGLGTWAWGPASGCECIRVLNFFFVLTPDAHAMRQMIKWHVLCSVIVWFDS